MKLLVFSLFSLLLFGQNQQNKATNNPTGAAIFTGYLVDEENNPIAGASVFVNKKNYEVKTNEKGYFKITLHEKDVKYYNYLNIYQDGFIFTQLPIGKNELPYHQTITLYKKDSKNRPNFPLFAAPQK